MKSTLTPREKEIIALVAQGKRYKEIARDLSISDFTVRTHLTAIRLKLQVTNTARAAVVAISQGLIVS